MEKRPIVAALVTLAVGAALFALQPEGDAPVATPQQPAPPATAAGGKVRPMRQTPTPLAPDAPPAVDPAARNLPPVAAAIADFALRNRLDPADVALRRLQAVTWPDGALGCPQPGSMVTQALVDGYWLELGEALVANSEAMAAAGEEMIAEGLATLAAAQGAREAAEDLDV